MIVIAVVAFKTSPTLQTLRPPKNTLVLVEIATRGEVQGKPFGVVPATDPEKNIPADDPVSIDAVIYVTEEELGNEVLRRPLDEQI